jgi:hypothetical protein
VGSNPITRSIFPIILDVQHCQNHSHHNGWLWDLLILQA